jgi:hypothetical protein
MSTRSDRDIRRKVWLGKLSERFEKLYYRVLSRLKAT